MRSLAAWRYCPTASSGERKGKFPMLRMISMHGYFLQLSDRLIKIELVDTLEG
jgi:hypothetical protein